MSDDLATFLRACLDEDRQIACRCLPGPWLTGTQAGFRISEEVDIGRILYGRSSCVRQDAELDPTYDRWGQVADLEMAWKRDEHIAHIGRHDPVRVLCEVEAKLKIVAAHSDQHECTDIRATEYPYVGCATLRLMATVYADHPSYREEWRP